MTISREERDKLFARCNELQSEMLSTRSNAEFDAAKQELEEIAGQLHEARGEYLSQGPEPGSPREEIEASIADRIDQKNRADNLLSWSRSQYFKHDD